MAAIPEPTRGTAHAIHGVYAARAAAEPQRGYLGWSQIGDECDRALWYSFRWAGRRAIDGRAARLFDTGHREEARVLQDLRDAGVQVWDRDPGTGAQFAVSSVSGHLRGHLDAVALGLPEAPKTPHLVDVKTIKTKKFEELLKKGMRALYPKYWAQAHGYMGRMKLTRAAFIFVCKDDDRIHVERFEYDPQELAKYEARAERIIAAAEPPLRISEDPAWFACKYCDFREVCHGTDVAVVSCRTCAHSTPVDDGAWHCSRHNDLIPLESQRVGCSSHRFIPILLEKIGRPVDATDAGDVVYETAEGKTFTNGAAPALSSHEIQSARDKRALTDAGILALRSDLAGLGAVIVA